MMPSGQCAQHCSSDKPPVWVVEAQGCECRSVSLPLPPQQLCVLPLWRSINLGGSRAPLASVMATLGLPPTALNNLQPRQTPVM